MLAVRTTATTALLWLPQAIRRACMRSYLDWLIRRTESDIAYVDYEIDFARRTLPLKKRQHRQHLSALRARRVAIES